MATNGNVNSLMLQAYEAAVSELANKVREVYPDVIALYVHDDTQMGDEAEVMGVNTALMSDGSEIDLDRFEDERVAEWDGDVTHLNDLFAGWYVSQHGERLFPEGRITFGTEDAPSGDVASHRNTYLNSLQNSAFSQLVALFTDGHVNIEGVEGNEIAWFSVFVDKDADGVFGTLNGIYTNNGDVVFTDDDSEGWDVLRDMRADTSFDEWVEQVYMEGRYDGLGETHLRPTQDRPAVTHTGPEISGQAADKSALQIVQEHAGENLRGNVPSLDLIAHLMGVDVTTASEKLRDDLHERFITKLHEYAPDVGPFSLSAEFERDGENHYPCIVVHFSADANDLYGAMLDDLLFDMPEFHLYENLYGPDMAENEQEVLVNGSWDLSENRRKRAAKAAATMTGKSAREMYTLIDTGDVSGLLPGDASDVVMLLNDMETDAPANLRVVTLLLSRVHGITDVNFEDVPSAVDGPDAVRVAARIAKQHNG